MNLIKKKIMLDAISYAITYGHGLAIGKLGFSEQLTVLFYLACNRSSHPESDPQIRPLSLALKYHFERQTGVFPTDINFQIKYANFYVNKIIESDFLGLFNGLNERKFVSELPFKSKFIDYRDTEPDRSIPYNASTCYLPYFAKMKILLIAPFASFAMQRSNKEIFESVWKKISMKWFYPASIQALDIPYGFFGQIKTFEQFENSINLYNDICSKIDKFDFDIALIAAGSLAIPLSVYIKQKEKVAISLGGHFQVLFGILGERWLRDSFWCEHYINENWARLPQQFIPANPDIIADKKSYW